MRAGFLLRCQNSLWQISPEMMNFQAKELPEMVIKWPFMIIFLFFYKIKKKILIRKKMFHVIAFDPIIMLAH